METEILDFFHRIETSNLSFCILFNTPILIYSRKSIGDILGTRLGEVLSLFSTNKFDKVDEIFQNMMSEKLETKSINLLVYFEDESVHKIKSSKQLLSCLSRKFFIYDDYYKSYYTTFSFCNDRAAMLSRLTSGQREVLNSICPNIFKIGSVDSILRIIYDKLTRLDNSLTYKDAIDRKDLTDLLCFYLYYKNESTKSE